MQLRFFVENTAIPIQIQAIQGNYQEKLNNMHYYGKDASKINPALTKQGRRHGGRSQLKITCTHKPARMCII
jgi:hypothetical protein